MAGKVLISHVFWFKVASTCPRIDEIPKPGESGRLLDLPESCALASLCVLDGQQPWAEVRVAWNPAGLAIAVLASGVAPQQFDSSRSQGFASARFWVDTRDTRTISRATRFCSHYFLQLFPKRTKRDLIVSASQEPVARAIADAPRCNPELIATRTELSKDGWTLEVFLPAQALYGFDPDINRRLGFAYQIVDWVREDQFLGVGREFPVAENPSLWSTLELID